MDYYRWYQEKYQEGYIGFRETDGTVRPFRIAEVSSDGSHSNPANIQLYCGISGKRVSVTDSDIVWELPELDRYFQVGNRAAFVRYRTNHTYRYAFTRGNLEFDVSAETSSIIDAIYNTTFTEVDDIDPEHLRGSRVISNLCALKDRQGFLYAGREVGIWRKNEGVLEIMLNPVHINVFPLLNLHYKIKGVGYEFED